jgi:hypothetical protein
MFLIRLCWTCGGTGTLAGTGLRAIGRGLGIGAGGPGGGGVFPSSLGISASGGGARAGLTGGLPMGARPMGARPKGGIGRGPPRGGPRGGYILCGGDGVLKTGYLARATGATGAGPAGGSAGGSAGAGYLPGNPLSLCGDIGPGECDRGWRGAAATGRPFLLAGTLRRADSMGCPASPSNRDISDASDGARGRRGSLRGRCNGAAAAATGGGPGTRGPRGWPPGAAATPGRCNGEGPA